MSTPVMSLRVLHSQRGVVRAVVKALKRDPKLAPRILAALSAEPDPAQQPVGPFKNEAAALDFLVGRLASALDPRQIWLFGSRARGDARPDSDFDLMVVFGDAEGERGRNYRRAFAPAMGSGLAVDVVPCLESEFAAGRGYVNTIANEVALEGRLLYSRDKGRTAA